MNFPPLQLQIFKNGEKIVDRESHSWTKNHYIQLFCVGANCSNSYTNLALVDTSGTNRQTTVTTAPCSRAYTECVLASATDNTVGIVVGTDNTAETWNDYQLGAIINHGAGAGQLEYSLMNMPGFSGNKTITHSRSFTNNSAGSIIIKEVGWIQAPGVPTTVKSILVARDVLSSSVTVNNGEIITVNYVITLGYVG